MTTVRTENLVKRYGTTVAVDHVNVEIREGSLTAILGPSGCGKTTLLRCIAGLIMPDDGRVYIGHKDMTRVEPFQRNIGMVFQRPSMFPHMTAYQNIAWALQLRKWPKEKIPTRVREMLHLVRLDNMEKRAFSQLSGGQAQRVVIARALAPEPDILLLDEPLSSLDAKLRDELKLEIAEIHRKTGCTTILVTHDQSEALTIADNVLLMLSGKIVQEGPPLEIYRKPQNLFSADFIGTNNFLPGKVVELGEEALVSLNGMEATLRVKDFPMDFSVGTPVWACVRADDIDIIEEDERHKYANVATVTIDHSSITGGMVIVEGKMDDAALPPDAKMRIHVGGSKRFNYLNSGGAKITCALGNVSVIRREEGELPPSAKPSAAAPDGTTRL
jgi:ABC-type Fe3+/spermidine/putrescine transport system ATPase subunit